ncbi:MAG TPA: ankyrin repeat domain-containing protein [Pseudobacteroides sp.]|nr:ankyrin repeat domain-containing protein [Pseudobacteroides sp.]
MSAIIVRMINPEYRVIDVNKFLRCAVFSDDIAEINKFISLGGNPNYIDYTGLSLLEVAITTDKIDAIKALIDAGANVNAYNSVGNSMLHLAVRNLRPDVVELLINNGADTNIKDSYNQTPLEYAISQSKVIVNGKKDENKQIIELLLDNFFTNIKTIEDFNKYINIKYNEVDTPMGKWSFEHTIDENDSSIFPYDYRIQTDWSGCDPYDIQYSIKFNRTDKNKTIEILKNVQINIANDAFKCFPNKKFEGGYYSGFYKYPYLKVGYESIRFLTWINYNYDLLDASDYESTHVTSFHWFNLFDDYNFTGEVQRTR